VFTQTHCIDDEREALQVGLAKRIRQLRPGSHLWLVMKGLRFASPTYVLRRASFESGAFLGPFAWTRASVVSLVKCQVKCRIEPLPYP